MRAKKNRPRDLRGVLFAIAATGMGIVLISMLMLFTARVRKSFYTYSAEPVDILRELNRNDYVDAWHDARENRAAGITKEKNPDYAVPYAVTDYFEAASYYSVFGKEADAENDGKSGSGPESDQARVYREKMDTAREEMGELEYLAEDIDELFR